jgi:Holliday junction resolvasome RuvABC endonuclease subunit
MVLSYLGGCVMPIKRTPVIIEPRSWVEAKTVTILGVDPGIAGMGMAVLRKEPGRFPETIELVLAETKKTTKKNMRGMRISADDSRRMRILFNKLDGVVKRHCVHAIAYEVYQPFKGRAGASWKTARVEGMIQGYAFSRDILLMPFLPCDIKVNIAGKLTASKMLVQRALYDRIHGFKAKVAEISEKKQEHVADAAAYAYIAFDEMAQIKKAAGIAM